MGAQPGTLVLSPYNRPYSKALGKDGILVSQPMHRCAEERADFFLQNYRRPDTRVDTQLMKQQQHVASRNKAVLWQIVLAVEFLAKQSLKVYEALVTFLDAILTPHVYPELVPTDGSCDWDTDTRVGLKAALSSFQTIAVFITMKSILDDVRPLTVKLQRRDQGLQDG